VKDVQLTFAALCEDMAQRWLFVRNSCGRASDFAYRELWDFIAAALTDLETANAELTAQRDVKEAELENALLVAAERLEARDTLKAEVERLRDAARDMMHAMGKHTVSCSTCKEMLRRHAETLRCCDDPAAQSGPGA